jgi:hypothetical protein
MTDLGSCRLPAELGGESLDLAAGFCERTRAVDSLSGETEFFLDGKLCGDAAEGFGLAKATSEEALELLLRLAPGDDQAVQIFVNAGFDEESGLDEGSVARAASFPFLELPEDDFCDARMDDGVETVEPGTIGEDNGAKLRAIHATIGGEHSLAKFLEDLTVGRLAGFDELVGERVGIEDGKAHFAKHCGDGALAAGNAAGEAESEHFS